MTLTKAQLFKKCNRCYTVIDRMIKLYGFPKPYKKNKIKLWVEADVDEWLRDVGFPVRRPGLCKWY